MSIVFAVRGTNMTAYHAGGMGVPSIGGTVSITSSTASGVIGGSYINMDQGALGQHALYYNGLANIPATQQFSVLCRCATSTTASAAQMFYFGFPAGIASGLARFGGTGVIPFTVTDLTGSTIVTLNETFGATQSVFYDFFWTCDLSLITSNFISWRDGVANGTLSTSSTRAATTTQYGAIIALGSQNAAAQSTTQLYLNEFVIWDSIINPTTVALTTGSGLNGSARTAFVQVTNSVGGSGSTIRGRPALGPPIQLV